ncbi:MAG: efflux RND transporter permease subunit [Anaerovoracaceae bacterium]
MLAKFSVRKPFTILVVVILIIVFGIVAFTKMTPDLFPSINMPYVMVMTNYTGASPEEVETQVTKPLEQQLATLDHIKNITSTSDDDFSMVALEFSGDVNMDAVSVDIREKIDLISGQWDEKITSPIIMKMNPDMMPVNIAAVNLKDKSTLETSTFVKDKLLTPLEGIEGVASVNATGMVSDNIQVKLSQKKINKMNKKMSRAIVDQFSDPKSKINNGINSAKGGKSQIDSGKSQITQGQKQLAVETEAAKIRLNQGKDKLKQLKLMGTALEGLSAQVNTLEKENRKIKSKITKQNPGKSKKEIEMLCMQNSTYASNTDALHEIDNQLQGMGYTRGDLNGLVKSLSTVDKQLAPIDKALYQLEVQSSIGSATLGNQMSELAASGGTVASTVMQLQSSLEQVQSSEDAALTSANLTGILTMSNVSSILNAQNFSMPAGYVTDGKTEVLVNVGEKITNVNELSNLVVMDMGFDGIAPIKLSDIAKVSNADNTEDTYAKINGNNGVLLTFTKQSGYATADVADRVNTEFDKLSAQHKGLEFTSLSDQGEYIHMVINSVLQSLLLGAILAIIILLLFLRDIRPTFITACSIPISVTFAIVLMYFSGVTLNVISLAGLAVGVGMLVDNSIVVIENIYRLRALGYSHTQAAVSGAGQVAGAITASTLTTICVFVPIVFVEGMTRQVFMDMALTISYSLIASLFIALTLVPAMARGMFKKATKKTALGEDSKIIHKYQSIVELCLHKRKWILIGAVVLLLGSTAIMLAKGFSYMPSMASTQLSVTIKMDKESELKDTADVSNKVSNRIMKMDGVETVGAMLASDANSMMGISMGGKSDVTQTMLYVILNEDSLDKSKGISKEIQKMGKEYDCEIITQGDTDMMSAMGGAGVKLNVFCDDLDTLRTASINIENQLKTLANLKEVSNTAEESTPELKVKIMKNKAMSKGLTVAQAYAGIAEALSKDKVSTTLTKGGDDTQVMVSSEKAKTMKKGDVEKIKITGKKADGTEVRVALSSIAVIEDSKTLNAISHDAQNRMLSISAGVKEGENITLVTDEAKALVGKMDLPPNVRVEFSGESETIMDAMKQMMLMLGLGMLMVYLVMVAQFQSLRSPLIVMFTVPLAFTGGMLALLITGLDISVVSLLGFVMLMGVIVNNAIVLVDCINRFRLEGMEKHEAIVKAGAVRIRPVLMTAITTILGLIPLAIGVGSGSEMLQPVAIVCIGGLVYATLMTLIVIPIMYSFMGRKNMVKVEGGELENIDA